MPAYLSRLIVTIDGVARKPSAANAEIIMANGIGTASATVTRDGGTPRPASPMRIQMGLDAGISTVFQGEIKDRGTRFYPNSIAVSGVGALYKARRKTNHVDTTWPGYVTGDPDLPTPEKLAYWAIGKTDAEHVIALLELAGITDHDIDGTGDVLNTINPIKLATGGSPWSLIQEIDKRTFYRTFDGPDGTVVRRKWSILPNDSAALTLTEGIDLYDGQQGETTDGMVSNVIVKGASYMGADDYPIVIEYASNEPETNQYGINDVLPYTTELFETYAQAEAWGQTALGEYGKPQERLSFTLAKGYANLRAGMTVAIVSDQYGYTAGSRFLVESVRHYIEGPQYLTSATFRGAASPTGTSNRRKPVVVLTYTIHREYIDGIAYDTIGLDGSESYDDAGYIALFVFAGSPTDPTPSTEGGSRATVSYPTGLPTSPYPTVTLTITNDVGMTASRTITIKPTTGTPVYVRDLWAAVDSELLYSGDGNKTWQHVAVAAVGCVREVNGYQLAWDAAGELYKVTIGGVVTLVLSGAGVTAAWVSYGADKTYTGVCYAGTADGKVYRSVADGVAGSWLPMTIAALGGALTTVSESPFAGGQIQATAADKLYESFDAGATFATKYAYGVEGMIAADFAAGFAKGLIGYTGADTSKSYVQERAGVITVAFLAADLAVQVRAITISGTETIFWVLGVHTAGGGVAYVGDLASGGELVARSWNSVRDGEPHDAMRDPDVEGLIYWISTDSIGKTVDGFANNLQILGLISPQVGKKIGIGPTHPEPLPRGSLVWHGRSYTGATSLWVYRLTDEGYSRVLSPIDGIAFGAATFTPMVVTTNGNLILYATGIDNQRQAPTQINCFLSTDGGATWNATSGLDYAINVQAGPDGVVYALRLTDANITTEVYRSDDNGVTWAATGASYPTTGGGYLHVIMAHPVDPLGVAIKYGAFRISDDGGATFTDTAIDPADQAGLGRGMQATYSPLGTHLLWFQQQPIPQDLSRALAAVGAPTTHIAGHTGDSDEPWVITGGSVYHYGGAGAYESPDNGATWSQIIDQAQMPSADLTWSVFGFVPGDTVNDWYALTEGIPDIALIRRLPDADPSAVWEDMTPGLLSAFPDEEYYCLRGSAVRLPGV